MTKYLIVIGSAILFCLLFDLIKFLLTRKIDGVLIIDTADPEKDKYLFEVENLEKMSKKKYLRLKVRKYNGRNNI